MKKRTDYLRELFATAPKITQEEHEFLCSLIERGVLTTFDGGAKLTNMSSTWLRQPQVEPFINRYQIGKMQLISFRP